MDISLRRARAVAQVINDNGVPEEIIYFRGMGKTRLLVKTGDGVGEAQNRRAEILIQP